MSDDDVPADLQYTKDHEWVRLDETGKLATIGITKFAAEQLGDITQVDLPKEGETIRKGDVVATVESVKAVSDVYAPLTGKLVKVNNPLGDSPEYLSDDPYDEGWMFQIELTNLKELEELINAEAYGELTKDS